MPFGNGALRLASSERSCHENDHTRSALDGWLALGQPVSTGRWQNTKKKLVKHKNHGTIAINIHQVEVNHHVETMSQLWCTSCERTSWVQHAVNNFVRWLVVPQELVAVLDLVVKTSCPSCPISDRLPTVIVEDKVRVPAFLKRFKEEEKHMRNYIDRLLWRKTREIHIRLIIPKHSYLFLVMWLTFHRKFNLAYILSWCCPTSVRHHGEEISYGWQCSTHCEGNSW